MLEEQRRLWTAREEENGLRGTEIRARASFTCTSIQSCTEKRIISFPLYLALIDLILTNQLKPNGEGSSELALSSYAKSSCRAFA